TLVQLPENASGPGSAGLDPDDSWRIEKEPTAGAGASESRLSPNYRMRWDAPREFLVNKPVSLKFSVHDQNGAGVPIETYLGMRGHMALRRDDGSVFTHLHPGGSPSMAAMQLSVLRTQGELPLKAAFGADEPLCQLPALSEREQEWLRGNSSPDTSTVSFPYAF